MDKRNSGYCSSDTNRHQREYIASLITMLSLRVQELCESRDGRPGLFVLMSLTVSVDVKQH